MAFVHDPEGNETRALQKMMNIRGKDVLEVGCGDSRLAPG